jgi:DNA (cytosine-5)-methyltransferase 1
VVHALTSEGADASEDGTGRGTPIISLAVAGDFSSGENVAQAVRAAHGQPGLIGTTTVVRRLSPLECERLQGFPDNWTRWDADGAEQSDSARYRRLGNAVAVPVVEWIARRIVVADAALVAAREVA